MQAAAAEDSVFAANRAFGRVALSVRAASGRTRRHRTYEDGPLRVRFPNAAGGGLEAIIVNTAGGIAGGMGTGRAPHFDKQHRRGHAR